MPFMYTVEFIIRMIGFVITAFFTFIVTTVQLIAHFIYPPYCQKCVDILIEGWISSGVIVVITLIILFILSLYDR